MVAVAPEHRGNGVGRALIQRAERLLRRQGLHLVSLYVRESSSAVGFYESWATRPRRASSGTTAIPTRRMR